MSRIVYLENCCGEAPTCEECECCIVINGHNTCEPGCEGDCTFYTGDFEEWTILAGPTNVHYWEQKVGDIRKMIQAWFYCDENDIYRIAMSLTYEDAGYTDPACPFNTGFTAEVFMYAAVTKDRCGCPNGIGDLIYDDIWITDPPYEDGDWACYLGCDKACKDNMALVEAVFENIDEVICRPAGYCPEE